MSSEPAPLAAEDSPLAAQWRAAQAEADLMRRAQAGETEALSALVVSWQERIYNLMLRLVRDPTMAADLTQEAFARAIDRLAYYRAEAAPFTWMFRLATNVGLSHLRQVKRRRTGGFPATEGTSFEERLPAQGASASETLERKEDRQQVTAALARLDEEQRTLLVLRDMEGMDYQAMAEMLEVPMGTLKSRLFRARLALRELLKDYMGG